MPSISVRVTNKLAARLRAAAKAEGHSVSSYLRKEITIRVAKRNAERAAAAAK